MFLRSVCAAPSAKLPDKLLSNLTQIQACETPYSTPAAAAPDFSLDTSPRLQPLVITAAPRAR